MTKRQRNKSKVRHSLPVVAFLSAGYGLTIISAATAHADPDGASHAPSSSSSHASSTEHDSASSAKTPSSKEASGGASRAGASHGAGGSGVGASRAGASDGAGASEKAGRTSDSTTGGAPSKTSAGAGDSRTGAADSTSAGPASGADKIKAALTNGKRPQSGFGSSAAEGPQGADSSKDTAKLRAESGESTKQLAVDSTDSTVGSSSSDTERGRGKKSAASATGDVAGSRTSPDAPALSKKALREQPVTAVIAMGVERVEALAPAAPKAYAMSVSTNAVSPSEATVVDKTMSALVGTPVSPAVDVKLAPQSQATTPGSPLALLGVLSPTSTPAPPMAPLPNSDALLAGADVALTRSRRGDVAAAAAAGSGQSLEGSATSVDASARTGSAVPDVSSQAQPPASTAAATQLLKVVATVADEWLKPDINAPTNAQNQPQAVLNWWRGLSPLQQVLAALKNPSVGNLNGVPIPARDLINKGVAFVQALYGAVQQATGGTLTQEQGNQANAADNAFSALASYSEKTSASTYLITYAPGGLLGGTADSYEISIGNPDTAKYVTGVVGGVGSISGVGASFENTPLSFDSWQVQMYNAAKAQMPNEDIAVIRYWNVPTPRGMFDAITPTPAREGGQIIANDVNSLYVTHDPSTAFDMTLKGFSYGATMMSDAGFYGARVNNFILMASPGADLAQNIAMYSGLVSGGHVYVQSSSGDPVSWIGPLVNTIGAIPILNFFVGPLGLGGDPANIFYGSTRLSAELDKPDGKNPWFMNMTNHNGYFSYANQVWAEDSYVMTGQTDQLASQNLVSLGRVGLPSWYINPSQLPIIGGFLGSIFGDMQFQVPFTGLPEIDLDTFKSSDSARFPALSSYVRVVGTPANPSPSTDGSRALLADPAQVVPVSNSWGLGGAAAAPGASVNKAISELGDAQSALAQTWASGNLVAGAASLVPSALLAGAGITLSTWQPLHDLAVSAAGAVAQVPLVNFAANIALGAVDFIPVVAGAMIQAAQFVTPVVGWLGRHDQAYNAISLMSQAAQDGRVYGTVGVSKIGPYPVVNVSVNGGPMVPVVLDTGSMGLMIGSQYVGEQGLGASTGSGTAGYGDSNSSISSPYSTYTTTVDFGNGIGSGPTVVNVVDQMRGLESLQRLGIAGILGVGVDSGLDPAARSVLGALPGELKDGVYIDLAHNVVTFGPNPRPTRASVPGAALSVLNIRIGDGPLQPVLGAMDSGGVNGTLSSSLIDGGSAVPAGTQISVYNVDGSVLLYQYSAGQDGAIPSVGTMPGMAGVPYFNTGTEPFDDHGMYVSTGGVGTTVFDL